MDVALFVICSDVHRRGMGMVLRRLQTNDKKISALWQKKNIRH